MNTVIFWDQELFKLVNQTWSHSFFDWFFPFLTDLHKSWPFQILILFFCFALPLYRFKRKGWYVSLAFVLAIATSDWTGNNFFKKTINRERPFEVVSETIKRSPAQPGRSFISNHSSNMSAVAAVTSVFFPPAKWLMIVFAALAAYSRVYTGVHFPLDVIAGALWGGSLGWLIATMINRKFRVFPNRNENRA